MNDFKVKFTGVRGSFPTADKNYLKYGGNTSCVEIIAGENLIVIDAGTGIVEVGNDLAEKYIASSPEPEKRTPIQAVILLSHIHMDHIMGLSFFKPIHINSTELFIYGPSSNKSDLKTDISEMVFGKTFPLDLGDISCKLEINDICDEQAIIISKNEKPKLVQKNYTPKENEVLINFYKSYVHPQSGVMIYKITYKNKSVVYASDKESYMGGDMKFIRFAKNCDLLIHDAQYTTEDYLNPYSPKQGFGHSTYDMATEAMKKTNAKNLVFYHYDPGYDDVKLNRIKEHYTSGNKNIQLSYEGLEINL